MLLGEATTAATSANDWLDWVSRAFALAALLLSLRTYFRGKAVDRRNVFIEIHRHLLEPDLVAARRRLYKIDSIDAVERLDADENAVMTDIYRVLAMFDLLGFYAESKWVDQTTVLEEWSDTLARSRQPAEHVLAWRRRVTDGPTWPHYQRLADLAVERVAERASLEAARA
jgi:hypothetical protein